MADSSIKKIGLGTWAFGGRAYGPMDDEVSLAVAARAYVLGVRQFDTAGIYAYGRSEELLGESISSYSDAKIFTKIGYDLSSGKPAKRYDRTFLSQSLDESLKRLRRPTIDLLFLHNPPTEVLEKPDVFEWLRLKIDEGKILRWGVSVYDSIRDAELALDAGAQAIEARYSLTRRDIIDHLPMNKWSFDFIARSPLGGGSLSGKYSGEEQFPKTDQRSAWNQEMFRTNNEFLSELKPLIDGGVAASFPELAIRFVAFSPRIALVIPGAKSIEQIESNVASVLRGPLPKDAVDLINTLRAKYLPKMIN